MLLIDTVLEKIVRAGSVGSMMEADGPLRRFFFWLMGNCHDERPSFFLSARPSWQALNPLTILLDSARGRQRWNASKARDAPLWSPWLGRRWGGGTLPGPAPPRGAP